MIITVALAAFAFGGAASAKAQPTTAKGYGLAACKVEMGELPAGEADRLCNCIVDNIETEFGPVDAIRMYAIMDARLHRDKEAEIAKLLGMTADEVSAWLDLADQRMIKVLEVCAPAE